MLKVIASMYDPIGIGAPYIMRGRCILQETCRLKLGCDDVLPVELQKTIDEWLADKCRLFNTKK